MDYHDVDSQQRRSDAPPEDYDELHDPIVGRLSLQAITLAVSAVFLVVGILGFIPGPTTDLALHHGPDFSGRHSHAMLFGLFMVSVLHNFVHLAYAAVGSVASFVSQTARAYFFLGGLGYLGVWIYGLAIRKNSTANFIPVNTADDWLHFGLGVGMIALGVFLQVRLRAAAREAAAQQD